MAYSHVRLRGTRQRPTRPTCHQVSRHAVTIKRSRPGAPTGRCPRRPWGPAHRPSRASGGTARAPGSPAPRRPRTPCLRRCRCATTPTRPERQPRCALPTAPTGTHARTQVDVHHLGRHGVEQDVGQVAVAQAHDVAQHAGQRHRAGVRAPAAARRSAHHPPLPSATASARLHFRPRRCYRDRRPYRRWYHVAGSGKRSKKTRPITGGHRSAYCRHTLVQGRRTCRWVKNPCQRCACGPQCRGGAAARPLAVRQALRPPVLDSGPRGVMPVGGKEDFLLVGPAAHALLDRDLVRPQELPMAWVPPRAASAAWWRLRQRRPGAKAAQPAPRPRTVLENRDQRLRVGHKLDETCVLRTHPRRCARAHVRISGRGPRPPRASLQPGRRRPYRSSATAERRRRCACGAAARGRRCGAAGGCWQTQTPAA